MSDRELRTNLTRRQEEEDRRTEIKVEWQHCALVIDRFIARIILQCSDVFISRFLLWVFIIATITATFRWDFLSFISYSSDKRLLTFKIKSV